MKWDSVFDLLRSLAEQKAMGEELKSLHYFYGFAMLLTMKKEIVRDFLKNEEGFEEYERLVKAVGEAKLDVQVLKQGIRLLIAKKGNGKSVQDILNKIKRENENAIPVDHFFKEIMEKESYIGEIFVEGKNLSDVINDLNNLDVEEEDDDIQKLSREEIKERIDEIITVLEELEVVEHSEDAACESSKEAEKWNKLAKDAKSLFEIFRDKVHGQDEAVRKFVRGYFQAEVLAGVDKERTAPKGLFLFAGPPGVGKTYLATIAANSLKLPFKRFDMSEYAGPMAEMELSGIPGRGEGILTGFVQKNPFSVLLFDEIEKASQEVIQLFLQILEGGVLKDSGSQREVDFKNTIIIFTTNAGKKLYEEGKDENLSLLSQNVILDALASDIHPRTGRELFPAAICSRFAKGNVIMFNHLKGHHLAKITESHFEKSAVLFQEKYGVKLEYDPHMSSLFLFHMSNDLDARIISSQSELFVRNELYEFSRQTEGQIDFSKLEKIKFTISVPEDPAIMPLFMKDYSGDIVVLGDTALADKMCVEDKIHISFAKDKEELENLIASKEVHFVIIDPMFGYRHGVEEGYFSMEDFDTEGIRCVEYMNEKLPDVPLYILENDEPMREVDKVSFQQMGARGVISCLGETNHFEQEVKTLLDIIYFQKKVDEISRQGKVLNYNTAQSVSKDGKIAQIVFHGFKLQMAINADSKKIVMSDAEKPKIRFCDVIGAKNAKEELQQFIKYLKHPKEYMRKGKKPAKGILLYGPPGTGKTMLAKAMAGEAGVTFLPTTATEFMKQYYGEGEEYIRTLFRTAKKYAPAVIFIDEIDAIGKERSGSSQTVHYETLLNTLLTEMDGFVSDPSKPVFVMAATNFAIDRSQSRSGVALDPALVRRFDNRICVDLPNCDERKEFINKVLAKVEDSQVTESAIHNVASRTTGESLAILQNILSLAMRKAEKEDSALTDKMLLDALEEFKYGEEHKWGKEYYESVAHHEAGHAYINFMSGRKTAFVTIVSRGNFGGYMQGAADESSGSYTRDQLLWMIRTSLAGRASEIVFYGEDSGINTGVSSDLEHATNVALQMVCRYGMSGRSLISISPDKVLNTSYGIKMLEEVEEILEREMAYTIKLVEEGRDKIDALASALLEKNQIMEDEIEKIFRG